jgi:exodeoxyribonuclease V alpha subunit
MNKNYITDLYHKGYITDTDVHFANFIAEIDKNDDPDIFLAAALVSRATENGDVYLDLGSVAETSISLELNGDAAVKGPELSEWSKKISQSGAVGKPGDFRPLILDKKNRLYLYRYWEYENHLSEAITRRMREDIRNIDRALLKDCLKRLFPENDDDSKWLKVAAVIAAFKKFCVITGGPGTGKTFTMAKILALLIVLSRKDTLNILLAAPTGKAAARIGESMKAAKTTLHCDDNIIDAIPDGAYTIHRMLKTIPGSPYFRHNAENPLIADIVVVDEASMVDLALMSKLMAAVPDNARLILIGDRDQLASVETGSVMADICERNNVHTFSRYFCKQFQDITQQRIDVSNEEQKENPGIYDGMVVLKKSYRFAESSGIGECSRAVNRGKIDEAFFHLKNNPDQIGWKEISEPDALSNALSEWVIQRYSEYLNADDPHKALELFSRFKILCAVKIGSLGVNAINRLAEQILSGKGLIDSDKFSPHPWYRGRPVLITRNDYSLELFNGDIGVTMTAPDSKSRELFVYFQGVSGEPRRFLPNRLPEHETAYAMTVHKSQGSEFETVLLILPNRDYPVLTRELLYTGITRARKKISIWGTEGIIKTTLSRKVERTSGLKDALWESAE